MHGRNDGNPPNMDEEAVQQDGKEAEAVSKDSSREVEDTANFR